MRTRFTGLLPQALILIAGTITAAVLASATLSARQTITITVPNYPVSSPLNHCEPHLDPTANTITLSNVPAGSSVALTWLIRSGLPGGTLTTINQSFTNQSGTVTYSIPYPEDTTTWPGQNGTNRFIVMSVLAVVSGSGGTVKIGGGPWKVVCTPVPKGGTEGCTPGFWRQVGPPFAHSDAHLAAWTPTGYSPNQDFEAVFGVNASFDPHLLGNAVWLGGGGEQAMARHAVAALLNAATAGMDYPLSVGEVIAAVQAAYASGDFETAHLLFEGFNELGCPL